MQIRFWKYLKIFWESVEVHPKSLKLDHETKTHMCYLCYLMFICDCSRLRWTLYTRCRKDQHPSWWCSASRRTSQWKQWWGGFEARNCRAGVIRCVRCWIAESTNGPTGRSEVRNLKQPRCEWINSELLGSLGNLPNGPMVFRHVSLGNQWVGMVWLCGMKPLFGSSTSDKCWPSFPSIDQ